MEEEKIQRLHDSLSKLRKGKGLGTNSHYSWNGHDSIPLKKDKDGNLIRDDGLPVNGLYSNFVKEGTYNPEKTKENASLRYGDGRIIKRNFDDIQQMSDENSTNSRKKAKTKDERKAEKKAAKLEAKRQAKLEEKKRLKLEAKRAARKNEKSGREEKNYDDSQEKEMATTVITNQDMIHTNHIENEKKSKGKKKTKETKKKSEKEQKKKKKKKSSSVRE